MNAKQWTSERAWAFDDSRQFAASLRVASTSRALQTVNGFFQTEGSQLNFDCTPVSSEAQRDGSGLSNLESSLESMTSHRSVLGYILLSRSSPATIIRHSGSIFEGDQGKKYAGAIKRMADTVQSGLEDISGPSNVRRSHYQLSFIAHASPPQDELKFMRIRTKRHEILISPSEMPLSSKSIPLITHD
jgi:dynein light chain roadblock-type